MHRLGICTKLAQDIGINGKPQKEFNIHAFWLTKAPFGLTGKIKIGTQMKVCKNRMYHVVYDYWK
jgi:hypothetical protein